MFYLRYLYLFTYSAQHILCCGCGFGLFFFVLLAVSLNFPFLIAPFGIL